MSETTQMELKMRAALGLEGAESPGSSDGTLHLPSDHHRPPFNHLQIRPRPRRSFVQDGQVKVEQARLPESPRLPDSPQARQAFLGLMALKETAERERDELRLENDRQKEKINSLQVRVVHTQEIVAERDQALTDLAAELEEIKAAMTRLRNENAHLKEENTSLASKLERSRLRQVTAPAPEPRALPTPTEVARRVTPLLSRISPDEEQRTSPVKQPSTPASSLLSLRGRPRKTAAALAVTTPKRSKQQPRSKTVSKASSKVVEWWRD